MAQPKTKKPTKLVVRTCDGDLDTYPLADVTDWSILFDNVLEIKSTTGTTTYIPLDSLASWSTEAA